MFPAKKRRPRDRPPILLTAIGRPAAETVSLLRIEFGQLRLAEAALPSRFRARLQ
jgi:hypothetical protein